MKRLLLVISSLVLLSGGYVIAQSTPQNTPQETNKKPRPKLPPAQLEVYSTLTPPTDYPYPDNSDKDESKLFKKDDLFKGGLKKGFNIKSIKLAKYSDYTEMNKNLGGDIMQNMQIHPNRLIWLVDIDAPEGLDLPQKGGQRVKFKKSRIISVFDAETGIQISNDVIELEPASAK